MAEILTFPRQAGGANHDNVERDCKGDGAAVKLLSALDGVGKTLGDLLLALLAELEDSSLRLSLIIERTAGEREKRRLRAEQQEIRSTIAELRRAIGSEARIFDRA
jgi:hypothetical protein